jgi:hypothetical protein
MGIMARRRQRVAMEVKVIGAVEAPGSKAPSIEAPAQEKPPGAMVTFESPKDGLKVSSKLPSKSKKGA